MAVYEGSVISVAAATAAAYATIRGSTTQRVRIVEIGLSLNAATSSSVGLGRPGNTPAASTSALCQKRDPGDAASICNVDTAWSTAPTVPSAFMRRIVLPATAGAGWVWTFTDENPLILDAAAGANQWVVLWNFGASTGSALSVYVVTRE